MMHNCLITRVHMTTHLCRQHVTAQARVGALMLPSSCLDGVSLSEVLVDIHSTRVPLRREAVDGSSSNHRRTNVHTSTAHSNIFPFFPFFIVFPFFFPFSLFPFFRFSLFPFLLSPLFPTFQISSLFLHFPSLLPILPLFSSLSSFSLLLPPFSPCSSFLPYFPPFSPFLPFPPSTLLPLSPFLPFLLFPLPPPFSPSPFPPSLFSPFSPFPLLPFLFGALVFALFTCARWVVHALEQSSETVHDKLSRQRINTQQTTHNSQHTGRHNGQPPLRNHVTTRATNASAIK